MASTPDNKQNIYKTVDARSERTRASSSKPYSKEETDSPRCEDKLDDKPACTPIAELKITEKGAARPTIRGRVISRTELKFYEHGHHKGSVFSIMVVDEASSSIRMVFFDKAADTYHGIIKEGLVFLFASVRVTAASSKYNPNAALE
ncbi:60S acidic ribosomal protein P1, partial [Perkinsus chesapeaki]